MTQVSQVELPAGVSLVCRPPEPPARFGFTPDHATPKNEHDAEIGLGRRIAVLSGLAKTLEGTIVIGGYAFAPA